MYSKLCSKTYLFQADLWLPKSASGSAWRLKSGSALQRTLRIHITVLVNNSLETKMHVLLVEATRRLLIEERGRGESTRQNILDDIPMTTCPFATAAFTIFNPSA